MILVRNILPQQAIGFHLFTFLVYAFATYYDVVHVKVPGADEPPRSYGGRWKYLTFWDLILQMVYFALSVVVDLNNIKNKQPSTNNSRLNKFRDFYFTVVIFPLANFVASTFWILYAWDRSLVYPKILDLYFPAWLNHVLHTFIVPTSYVEMFIIHHKYVRRSVGISWLVFLSSLYILWTLYLAYFINIWTYPIFAVLNTFQRICFFSATTLLFVVLYVVGEKLNNILWSNGKGKNNVDKAK